MHSVCILVSCSSELSCKVGHWLGVPRRADRGCERADALRRAARRARGGPRRRRAAPRAGLPRVPLADPHTRPRAPARPPPIHLTRALNDPSVRLSFGLSRRVLVLLVGRTWFTCAVCVYSMFAFTCCWCYRVLAGVRAGPARVAQVPRPHDQRAARHASARREPVRPERRDVSSACRPLCNPFLHFPSSPLHFGQRSSAVL